MENNKGVPLVSEGIDANYQDMVNYAVLRYTLDSFKRGFQMKYLVAFSRIFVGVLFIFSGFIKLNDPLGFSFKLEEYFSEGVLNLPFFGTLCPWVRTICRHFRSPFGCDAVIGFQGQIYPLELIPDDLVFYFFNVLFGLFQQGYRLRLFW